MTSVKKYKCPVCGYDGLNEVPYNETGGNASFEICPCCNFEYGFDDYSEGETFASYREKWLKNGAKFSDSEIQPLEWNLEKALEQIKSIR